MNINEAIAFAKAKYAGFLNEAQAAKAEVTNKGIELGGELLVSVRNLRDNVMSKVDVVEDKIEKIVEEAKEVVEDAETKIEEVREEIVKKVRGRSKKTETPKDE